MRDDTGRSQGTMLVEVLAKESTDTHGHWFSGAYILASDSHLRWWMAHGEGKKLAARCRYHCCEGTSVDCVEVKGGKGMHFEKFRLITKEELANKTLGWAFSRACTKEFKVYLAKRKDDLPPPKGERAELPWREPGDEDEGAPDETSESDDHGLKDKLKEARDRLKRLEQRHERAERKAKKKRSRGRSAEKKKDKKKRRCSRSRRRRRREEGSPQKRAMKKKTLR